MNAKLYLKQFSERFEETKSKFFEKQLKEANKVDKIAARSILELKSYMVGGKNARGALTLLGYKVSGAKNNKDIYMAALAIELLHNALIIHDDYVDNDKVRRGKPTIHKIFEKEHGEHYGASMSMMVGDIAIFLANQILSNLSFESKNIMIAMRYLNQFLINTGFGELMDIDFDFKKDISWKDVLKVRIYKTAHYTFSMPLAFGAALGGATKGQIDNLTKYGEPVGLAFQLRDDVLGVFGDSSKTGKSNDSDIREGKKTLLYLKSIDLASAKDSKLLKKWYGSKDLDNTKIDDIRVIIKRSGGLDYSNNASIDFIEKGKKFISKMSIDNDTAETLATLADYMIERDK